MQDVRQHGTALCVAGCLASLAYSTPVTVLPPNSPSGFQDASTERQWAWGRGIKLRPLISEAEILGLLGISPQQGGRALYSQGGKGLPRLAWLLLKECGGEGSASIASVTTGARVEPWGGVSPVLRL